MGLRNPDIGATISERISSANNIKKETMMQDSTMAILGEFNGIADIKAVQKNSSTGRENFSVEQTFIGNYKLDTTVAINRGPKEVLKQDETTALFWINLNNDGNKTLVPIYITDSLPDGLTFINSSLLPDIVGKEIRWSIPSLQIRGKLSITLRASLKDTGSRFINRVKVSAQYNGGMVNAVVACGFVLDRLPCCLIEKVPIKKLENEAANYVARGWAPPKSFELG